ncbi:MAG: hypothetical protein QXN08_01270 [Nitrososphaerales archaeon]
MSEKQPKQVLKSIFRGNTDYRGVLAILIILGLIISLLLDKNEAALNLGPLAGSAVGWYFADRRRRSSE